MSLMHNSFIIVVLGAYIFAGCSSDQVVEQPVPLVKVVEVIKKDVPISQSFVGEVSGLYDIPIRARVDGFLEKIAFDEGTKVDKGQILYLIDEQPYLAEVAAMKSKVAEVKTRLVNAENELRRIKPLADINAVSKSDLDAAVANEGASRASVEAALANLRLSEINLGYTRIVAPISGLIGKTQAKAGEYVGKYPNPVILNTISRIDTVIVQFFITESDYLKFARDYFKQNQKNNDLKKLKDTRKENLEMILADGSVHESKGSIDFIDREVDPTTGSILIQASFPNPNNLVRPGQFAKVNVDIRSEKDAKLIPARCVIDVQGKHNVYLIKEDSTAQLSEIEILAHFGDLVLVGKGLNHDDLVVVEGIQMIRSGVKVQPEAINFESKSQNPF